MEFIGIYEHQKLQFGSKVSGINNRYEKINHEGYEQWTKKANHLINQ